MSNSEHQNQSEVSSQQADFQEQQKHELFFHLIQKVGSGGKYQLLLFILLCILSILAGGVLLITPFLFYQQSYYCGPNMTTDQCLSMVCTLPTDQQQQYANSPNIYSFLVKFPIYQCPSEQNELNVIKTIFYSGQLFGFFFSAIVGDYIRAKYLLLLGLVIGVVGVILVSVSPWVWLCVTGMFLSLGGCIISYNLTFIFITELVEERKRQTHKVVLSAIFSVGALFNVLWFYVLPNFEIVLLAFYGLPIVITGVLFLLFFKDTPISLITKYEAEKAYNDLLYIAKINGIDNPDLTLQQIQKTQQVYKDQYLSRNKDQAEGSFKKFTFIDLFRYKSLRYMTTLLVILDCVFALQYLSPTLMLNQFNFNIFINGLVIESAQVFAGLIPFFTIYKLPRRWQGVVSFAIICACSIVLIFVWDQNATSSSSTANAVLTLLFMFLVVLVVSSAFTFYAVYLNELFPTQVRIVGIGFIKSFGSITGMASSQIISACFDSGFRIMILFAILAAICIVITYLLPETHGKRPPEVILELQPGYEQLPGSEGEPAKRNTTKPLEIEISSTDNYHKLADENIMI